MTFERLRQLPPEEVTLDRLAHAFWRRLAAIPDDLAYRLRAGPGSENYRRLRSIEDRHKGERCFILGNGPSLAETDLTRLRGETSFGLNRIYLMFDRSGFRPSFYVCMNGLVLDQSADPIRQLAMPRFLNWSHRALFPHQPGTSFLRESFSPSFSTDLTKGVWGGATVTFVAMQIAYYMGFEEVILLGVDHRYRASGTPHTTVVRRKTDQDHFDPAYFPQGFRWQLPDLRTSEIAYRMAREAFERDGRRIVDATLGGALEVFPKESLEELTARRGRSYEGAQPEGRPTEVGAELDQHPTTATALGSRVNSSGMPRVGVGIVTWNSARYLPACLAAIGEQTYPNINVIVVDNASTDNSVHEVQSAMPEATLIRLTENVGYGAAQNRAIRMAQCDYYLPLNPDVRLGKDYVSTLVEALERSPRAAAATGKLWLGTRSSEGDHLLDGTGLFLDRRRHQYLRGHGQVDRGQYDMAEEVFGVDGAAPLLRSAALEQLMIDDQVYDEAFFVYMEDVDLAWRARLMGWTAVYDPRAIGTHDRTFKPGSRRPVPKQMRRHAVKNRYFTLLKNEGIGTWKRDWWRILSYDISILGYVLLFEQSSIGAYGTVYSQRARIRRWRREIWNRAQTDEDERRRWFG